MYCVGQAQIRTRVCKVESTQMYQKLANGQRKKRKEEEKQWEGEVL